MATSSSPSNRVGPLRFSSTGLWLLACTISLFVPACDDKKKPEAAPVPPATTKTEPSNVRRYPKLPEGVEIPQLNKHPFDENDPLTWPVEVEVDKNGRAIPPKTTMNRHQNGELEDFISAVFDSPLGEFLPQRRYIQSGGGSPYFRQPFKTIVRPPKSGGTKGGSSKHQAGPNGERYYFDADTGNLTIRYPDGSTETQFGENGKDGSLFTYPPGTHPKGITQIAFDEYGDMSIEYEDGTMIGVEEGKDDEPSPKDAPAGKDGGDQPQGEGAGIPSPDEQAPGQSGSADPQKQYGEGEGDYIDEPGPGSDPLSQGVGEPHYLTRDGTGYTTQAAGEFVLVTGVNGRAVQARHEPWKGDSPSVSAITALAFQVGNSKVEVRLDGTVMLDGVKAQDAPMVQGDIPGGGVVGAWRKDSKLVAAVVLWPDLSAVWIRPHESWMDFSLQWVGPAPEHKGLLGSNDGDASNDLTDRQGTVAKADDAPAVTAFVNSWRVTDEESLFTYDEGKSTATYTLLDFPREQPEPIHTDLAEECCGHLPEGFTREMCIYDVSITGEKGFADSYKKIYRWNLPEETAAKKDSAPESRPAPKGDGVLTADEMKAALVLNLDESRTINETLGDGESKVYRFEFNDPNSPRLGVLSEELDPTRKFTPGVSGYGLFDDQGAAIGDMNAATNDFPMVDLKPGTYYIKIVGPGLVHIKLN